MDQDAARAAMNSTIERLGNGNLKAVEIERYIPDLRTGAIQWRVVGTYYKPGTKRGVEFKMTSLNQLSELESEGCIHDYTVSLASAGHDHFVRVHCLICKRAYMLPFADIIGAARREYKPEPED